MADLAECELATFFSSGKKGREAARALPAFFGQGTKNVCNYDTLTGLDLDPSSANNYSLYSDATRCYVEPTPGKVPPSAEQQPSKFTPISYDRGCPINYSMPTVQQTFEICEWDRDLFNQHIRQLSTVVERGGVGLDERPVLKDCGATPVSLRRNGTPLVKDGIPNDDTTVELLDADAESSLFGLYNRLVAIDSNNKGKCFGTSESVAARRLTATLDKLFDETKMNSDLYKKSLLSESATATPYIFNNLTKSRYDSS